MAIQPLEAELADPNDQLRSAAARIIRSFATDSGHGLRAAADAIDVTPSLLLSVSIGEAVAVEDLDRVSGAIERWSRR